MKISTIVDEDFSNYKKVNMFIGIPFCDGKCNIEAKAVVCQNNDLDEFIEVPAEQLIARYLDNPFTKAIVIGGREPFFKNYSEVLDFVTKFRKLSQDDIVIFTGYYENEVADKIAQLRQFKNIIIKFGRFIPNAKHKIDEVLGVELASDNQYAKKIS